MAPYVQGAVIVAILLLQSTWAPEILGDHTVPLMPMLPVVAVVCWGIHRGPVPATWWAVAFGALLDLQSFRPAGFYTVPMLAVAATVALYGRRVFEINLLMPLGLTVAATAIYGLAQYALVSGGTAYAPWTVRAIVEATLPLIVLNLVCLPVLYYPLRALAERIGGPRLGWER